ncbi:MAG: 2-oxoacid:acceptor oxidoreductase family protein [Sporomusaceae bacterium]|nr:2-oxoacid:acceptor oxidoreductase family protein [Sporomusaceae bacterium]
MHKILKILLAGEGGQGIQSIAEIVAEAANREGKEALYIPNFGVEQRGGISMAYLQITEADEKIGAPKFETADILIALSARAIARTRHYAGEETLYIYDNSLIEPAQVNDEIIGLQYFESTPPCPTDQAEIKTAAEDLGDNRSCFYFHEAENAENKERKIPRKVGRVIAIAANDTAKNELHPRVFNIMILGTLLAATSIMPLEAVQRALEEKLGHKFQKDPKLRELNEQALAKGYEMFAALVEGGKNG